MNAHELNQRLCDQIEVVLNHLFPNGKKVRGEFCVGGLHGQTGDSLKVHLGGMKKGFWADFADNGARGRSLLGLWAEVAGGDYALACREAKRFLGIADDYERRLYRTPAPRKETAPVLDRSLVRGLQDGGLVERYLVEDRKLEAAVLLAYRVAESAGGDAVVFPFFATEESEEGAKIASKASFAKFLKVARDAKGKKEIWTSPAGVTDCLFGKNAKLPANTPKGVLVITEGEIDALSVACYGYRAVSVPRGAKAAGSDGKSANDQWIESDFAWLTNFERIYLWLDDDEPGRQAARDIAQRIGLERCFIVQTPGGFKDANECLVNGMPATKIVEALEGAQTLDPANLLWAGEFADRVFRRLFPPGGIEPGREFLWPFPWKIRGGEMTTWTGFSGHGKTVLLNQLAVHLAEQGDKIVVASMEVEPDKTLETLWCQANGARLPFNPHDPDLQKLTEAERLEVGEEIFRERYQWLAERFLIFVPEVDEVGVGRANWRQMLQCFVYARQRYGCTQFIVDSLMMCVGRSEQEYQEVELFVNALSAFAKRHQVHVHLVAHSRKKDDESKPPGKQDIAGPKETADISCNVAVVHRNMAKTKKGQMLERELKELRNMVCATAEQEEARTADITESEKELKAVRSWHDGELHLLKQRFGDGELASKYLYFLTGPRQFVEGSPWAPTRSEDSYARVYLTAARPEESALPTTEELTNRQSPIANRQ